MSIFADIVGREGWGDRTALLGDEGCDYGTLLRDAQHLAEAFRAGGLTRRQTVAICLPVSRGYVTALLAAYLVDAVIVPINPNSTADEIGHVLGDSSASLLVSAFTEERISRFAKPTSTRSLDGLCLSSLDASAVNDTEDGDRFLIYTSGSTGRPKGVILTDLGLSHNISAVANHLALSPGDRTIVFTPPSYTYALNQVFIHLWAGGALLPYRHGLMYPVQIPKAIAEHRMTGLAANPTSLRLFVSQRTSGRDLSSVRYIVSGGQPLYSRLAASVMSLFPQARITSMYGCTENGPRVSHGWLPSVVPARESAWPVGPALAGTTIKIVDPSGQAVARGETGEICVGGRSMMRGYWRQPELTRATVRNGWFHSGDLGYFDDAGELVLVGRANNIISVGHEKVSPEEVEAVIGQVDGVTDVAVGGAPDPLLDTVAVALVVSPLDIEAVTERVLVACRNRLSSPKNPRRVFRVNDIPKTPYGKHDRKAIKSLIGQLVCERELSEVPSSQ